jgi:hypothetical protein
MTKMKIFNIKLVVAVIFAGTVGISCEKEFKKLYTELPVPENTAYYKVFDAALQSQRTGVYIDNIPISGPVLAYNIAFPSTGFAAAVAPGSKQVLIRDTSGTSLQPHITFTHNFEANKRYTTFIYDTLNAVKAKTIEDVIVVPDDTTARLRFANFIFSSVAIPNVDVYSVKKGANIFTDIPPTGVTDFIPYASNTTDTLYVRATGTTTNLNGTLFTVNPAPKRSYTVVFRGRYQSAITTGIGRLLSLYTNN